MRTAGDDRTAAERAAAEGELLRVDGLVKHYDVGRRHSRRGDVVRAVEGISLTIRAGRTLALVGESGCGKSTAGRMMARLVAPTDGRIWLRGQEITGLDDRQLRPLRRQIQFVFQDPLAALNPRRTVRATLRSPLRIHGLARDADVEERMVRRLELVGLGPEHLDRHPHELSGGQRQRVVIARALMLDPQVLVLDEPVSGLDVAVQAQTLNLLAHLQKTLGLAFCLISHDLSVVHHMSDDVAIMYLGKIVEVGPREEIYARPAHPYTQALLSAVPVTEPGPRGAPARRRISGDVPSPLAQITGCSFRTRCWRADDRCAEEEPLLRVPDVVAHEVACHHPGPDPA